MTNQHNQLALFCQSTPTEPLAETEIPPEIDLNAQKKAELEAQIQQLQAERDSL
jgi:hypothetical protein